MKYDVHCIFGGTGSEDDPTHGDIMHTMQAVFDTVALHGGRIIASHTMQLGAPAREYLFMIEEMPDGSGRETV